MSDIVDKVREAGIIGAGGAGFPTHVKLDAKCEYVIANGAECEPLLHCDQQVMATYPDKVVRGIELAMEATSALQGIIALKWKYKEAIEALGECIQRSKYPITLHKLENYYPAGDEHILVYETTGRIVPEGGIPLDIGAVVSNVSTLTQIAEAEFDTPVTRRMVTITGAVRSPKTLSLPIGTLVQEAITLAGGTELSDFTIIDGGPMMGKVIPLSSSIAKTTNGIIVLPSDHPLIQMKTMSLASSVKRARSACEQCSLCTEFCPRYLLGHNLSPHLIMRAVGWGVDIDSSIIAGAYLCCECGLCGLFFACPMKLSPDRYNAALKVELAKAKIENPHHRSDLKVDERREGRRVPIYRLISRLALNDYDVDAPLSEERIEVDQVKISLKQHIGAPSKPVVSVGDRVREGDLIADIPPGALGAKIHSSISGTVKEISPDYIVVKG